MTRAAAAVWDFVVGDDWLTALGVVVAIAATAVLESAGVTAWWVMPASVLLLLVRSLDRARAAADRARRPSDHG
ncbi:MAG: hypothetical protein WAL63_20505 [Solirubrobacteraceae bacterium]